jgi:hypothetical protein
MILHRHSEHKKSPHICGLDFQGNQILLLFEPCSHMAYLAQVGTFLSGLPGFTDPCISTALNKKIDVI